MAATTDQATMHAPHNCLKSTPLPNQAGVEELYSHQITPVISTDIEPQKYWFVMRDLKRPNTKYPAYKQLGDAGFQVFTPFTSKIIINKGKRTKIQIPYIPDLLFVYAERERLDKEVSRTKTLQYRYVKGAPYCTPMTVPPFEMTKFIAAVSSVKSPQYLAPEDILPSMYGSKVKIICDGPLNGLEGKLLKVKGSGRKRFLVELPGVLTASIEIEKSDYIELIED